MRKFIASALDISQENQTSEMVLSSSSIILKTQVSSLPLLCTQCSCHRKARFFLGLGWLSTGTSAPCLLISSSRWARRLAAVALRREYRFSKPPVKLFSVSLAQIATSALSWTNHQVKRTGIPWDKPSQPLELKWISANSFCWGFCFFGVLSVFNLINTFNRNSLPSAKWSCYSCDN